MSKIHLSAEEIKAFYANFDAPLVALDCGMKCAPYNEGGKPFCCDICVAVPTLYQSEWAYVLANTDLWFEWKAESCTDTPEEAAEEVARLKEETPDSMILAECLGPEHCQRGYRGLTCRQFPFFPYIDSHGEVLGLSYYWEYEEKCWVISNMHLVTEAYKQEFLKAFEIIFEHISGEFENYQHHSKVMREEFKELRRAIPLLHRNGFAYKISTHNERMRRVPVETLPKYGDYKLAASMPFPDEI
jgi:hypothetical protein